MQSVEEKQTKTGFLKEEGVINWCEMMKSSNLSGLVCLKKERSCRLLRSLSLNSSADDTLNVFRTFFFQSKDEPECPVVDYQHCWRQLHYTS